MQLIVLKPKLASVKSFSLKGVVRLTRLQLNELGGETLTSRSASRKRELEAILRAGWRIREACAESFLGLIYLLITIMVPGASHPHLAAQEVTPKATAQESLPDEPGAQRYPTAEVVPQTDDTTAVEIESDTQSKTGSLYVLDGDVVIKSRDRIIEDDHIEYDTETGEVTATGHLHASGGRNHRTSAPATGR